MACLALKQVNPATEVSVKRVAQRGVGTIAAGVVGLQGSGFQGIRNLPDNKGEHNVRIVENLESQLRLPDDSGRRRHSSWR